MPPPTLPRSHTPTSDLLEALTPFGRYGVQLDVALAPHTSFRIGGPAAALLTISHLAHLEAALRTLHHKKTPFLLLGGGSNVLVSDAGIPNVVILNQCRQINWPEDSTEPLLVRAEAGASLAGLARAAIKRHLAGLAWAVSIPGTVGGAIVGNAGAHGGAIADSLQSVSLWEDGQITEVPASHLQFDYRRSRLKNLVAQPAPGPVVLSATFRLRPDPTGSEAQRAETFIDHRRRTQPIDKSAGSIFKNPPGDYAGRLIEQAGLKGVRVGQVSISAQHANFIINHGKATAAEVIQLMNLIRRRVYEQFGVALEAEIQLIGDWSAGQTIHTMSSKLRVGVLFGGRSGEHGVSLMSAQSVLNAIDKTRYEIFPIGIDRTGRWMFEDDPLEQLVCGGAAPEDAPLWPSPEHFTDLDVILPILHGTYGEDGTLQGLLDLAGIPYVGCGVLASSLAMDKAVSRMLFQSHGLPQTPWGVVFRARWEANPTAELDRLEAELAFPMFTKPANLGSSVGIRRVNGRTELSAGIDEAARYDRKIIVEQGVANAREIEVSVLGNDDPIASVPGEIVPSNEFYDYAAKYLDGASRELIPAPITPEQAEAVRSMAVRAFRAVDGSGLARADFLLDGVSGEIFLNEINTMPGFTNISMYPKLWEASGLPYSQLINRLIELAMERHTQIARNQHTYDTESKD